MPAETLPVAGYRELPVPNALIRTAERSRHLAILFPGFGYRNTMPALYYSRDLMQARGADVLTVDYVYDLTPAFTGASDDEKLAWIRADASAVFDTVQALGGYDRLTIIGKSAGTAAMAMTIPEREGLDRADLIWLTPGFRIPQVPAGMARCRQRSFLAIGTADPHYDEEHLDAARRRGAEVVVMPDLDHGLEKPGDVVGSVSAMVQIIRRLNIWID